MALDWSPDQYARHRQPRLRPGLDLIARIERRRDPLDRRSRLWRPAPFCRRCAAAGRPLTITGVDLSPAMLEAARTVDPEACFVEADAASWRPAAPVDLIFSNAALHWVPDHRRLLPELLARCRLLAVQMPHNDDAPSHRLLRELAREPPWQERLGAPTLERHVLEPADYLRLLGPEAARVDLWETIYHQPLTGADPVLEWVRGTTLLPIYEALGGRGSEPARAFEAAYAERLRAAYPAEPSGITIFPFRRLFLVAER